MGLLAATESSGKDSTQGLLDLVAVVVSATEEAGYDIEVVVRSDSSVGLQARESSRHVKATGLFR